MKFFRLLFNKSDPAAADDDAVDAAYSDVLSKPANNEAIGTAELTAQATRKAHQRVERDRNKANSDQASGKEPGSDKSTMSMIRDINAKLGTDAPSAKSDVSSSAAPAASAAPSIWDLDDDAPAQPGTAPAPTSAPAPAAQAAAAPAPRATARQRRTKTRLIGFEKSDGNVVDAFGQMSAPAEAEEEPAIKVTFPVGWLLVVKGPGRGESFPLINGLSSIGRGGDQTVPLKFGDGAISRSGHAAIVYDGDKRSFTLGHGNKANIVRLNDQPLISNELLKNGDIIRIGETTLRLVTLCGDDFDWSDFDDGGDEDVAIA